MRPYPYLIVLLAFVALAKLSCRKNFEFAPSAGNLEFSKDTVFLDTIFSNIGSSTYNLKVYNPTRDDIEIPSIRLQQGEESGYRLNVDGVAGKQFQNIPILAQDSMFIFVETTLDVSTTNENEFLYTDKLLFDVDDNQQEVELVTLVRDAVFLFPQTNPNGTKETISLGADAEGNNIVVPGFTLNNEQLQFTNEKPYVIYGYGAVPTGNTATMEAGTRVHFHKDSGIYVEGGAQLQINGSLSTDLEQLENEVIFQGDRLEHEFDNIPGQWGSIILGAGSTANIIDHLTIKNATVGILIEGNGQMENSNLSIKNSQIHNSLKTNLWAKAAAVSGENLVLGAAGEHSLYCNLGGDYLFKHCTIANYWTNGFRLGTALQLDNFLGSQANDLERASFVNCIIDGTLTRELSFSKNSDHAFNFSFEHCLISFDKTGQFENSDFYQFENESLYENSIFNESAGFIEPFKGDYRINESSAGNFMAQLQTAMEVPFDITGKDRTVDPDIGAYQTQPED